MVKILRVKLARFCYFLQVILQDLYFLQEILQDLNSCKNCYMEYKSRMLQVLIFLYPAGYLAI